MTLSEFRAALLQHPDHRLAFVFDDGEEIPAEFHITEVGHVMKNFIDCGGTRRSVESCLLQAWIAANDKDHRLAPGKLAKIIDLAAPLFPSPDLPVELEYEGCVISQYEVSGHGISDGTLKFTLADKHTDCLAKEACGLESGSQCCSGPAGSGCC